MERAEAEAVYEQGRETVVAVLLELSAQNALLRREVAELSERLAKQEERIAELERRLNRNSRNSSLPPSQDPPAAPERRQAAPSGRGRGAQPGHPGRGRHLAPIEALDELIDHWPSRCRCGHVFCAAERAALGAPARHQVAELPPTAVILSEHRLQRLRCPECGAVTRAELPAGVPPGAFGPRLQAAVATLAVRNRVSRRDTTELLRELFGAAALDRLDRRHRAARGPGPRRALRGPARPRPRRPGAQHRRGPAGACAAASARFWGALTGRAAVFRIAEGRHRREAQALLGEDFSGVACSDRWWALRLPRPAATPALLGAPGARLHRPQRGASAPRSSSARPASRSPQRLFAAWGEFRGDADRARLLERIGPLQEELRALLEEAARKSARNRRHRTFAKNLLKRWPALWTFASVPGVEPTNNHAERGLRGAVIYRKLSLGSQSEEGERTIERLLSASVTCRLQRRSLFAYLSDVLAAKIRGDPIPLLT